MVCDRSLTPSAPAELRGKYRHQRRSWQHPLVRQLLADACGVSVVSTASREPVLLGSAILGAVAGRVAASLPEAMKQFTQVDATYHSETAFSPLHQRRYAAYKALQQAGRLIRE